MEEKKETVQEAVQEEKQEVAAKTEHTNIVADFEHGVYGSSDSFKMAYQMAKALSQSTIVPQHFQRNEANCLVAISQAQKMNIDPFTVMQNMYMIQGKISWKSSFLIAMINASGKYDTELQFEEEEKAGEPYSCRCWTTKDGRRVDGIKVTMDMAEKEGWTKKNGSKWKTLPGLMLRYRAASFFANLNCPELTSGFYTREEMLDNDFGQKESAGKNLNDLLSEDEEDSIDAESMIIE
jgi:exonuclease I